MSRQKTLSGLIVAAATLLVTAVPAFAQTDSVDLQADSRTQVVIADSAKEIALNGSSRVENPFKVFTTTPKVDRKTSVSPAAFRMAMTRSLVPNDFVKSETTVFQAWNPAERVNEPEAKETSPKRITFVPSLGQKLPE
jgi:hypothetical protein